MRAYGCWLAAVSVFGATGALAAPGVVHQGRLLASTGDPISGAHDLTFALYGAASGGVAEWTETDADVPLQDGYFTAILGDAVPLDAVDWAAGTWWLGVAVDGDAELAPRTPIGAVPFALVAANANGGAVQPPILGDAACDGTAATMGLMRVDDATDTLQVCTLAGSWRTLATIGANLYAFSAHTFTSCGQSGRTGPSLSTCTSAYETTWDSNPAWFGMQTNGIQRWTVPATGTYRIRACGAQGGGNNQSPIYPGRGACIQGDVALEMGEVLQILVGQSGSGAVWTGGGGGGSYVVRADGTPLVIGGGGAGASRTQDARAGYTDASTGTSGRNGYGSTGGSNGAGGGVSSAGNRSGAGGGLLSAGGNGVVSTTLSEGGAGFAQGGIGGNCGDCTNAGVGGFGGGGGAYHAEAPGGGGGYSGGGGGQNAGGSLGTWDAGGGGSFNAGTNQVNSAGAQVGHGQVTITRL